MWKNLIIFVLCLGLVLSLFALHKTYTSIQNSGVSPEDQAVENFRLIDQFGESHELYYYDNYKAVVLFVHGNGCPIVRLSFDKLRGLRDRYEKQGVKFLMLNANTQDDRTSILKESEEFNIDVPILNDEHQVIARSLDIDRTAEAIVIETEDWTIPYRGALDDQLGYETQKPMVSKHYLADALDAVLAGKRPEQQQVDFKGCAITFPPLPDAISYADNVAPILLRKCVPCHQERAIAPWAMTSHRKVKGWSEMMLEVLRTGRMPPWFADPHIGEFDNDRSLTDDEFKTLTSWLEAGSPRHGLSDPLTRRRNDAMTWPLGEPDLILTVGRQDIPATGLIPYRHIELRMPFDEDVWIRAVDLRPSNPRVLHHADTFMVPAGWDWEKHQYPFFREGTFNFFSSYTPGSVVLEYPENTGKRVPKGAGMIFQLHYTATGKPETDETRLGLYLHKEPPEKELLARGPVNMKFMIPAGAPSHEVTTHYTFKRNSVLYEMRPHMHYRGKSARFELYYPDGSSEIILSVPRYDFNWQLTYRLAEPKHLPAGTKVTCRATFDNSIQNAANPDPDRDVGWGLQSEDEMLISHMHFTRANE